MKYEPLVGDWTTPNGKPVRFAYRADTNDWNTISSCTTHDEYGLRGLSLTGWALDIGAYLGPVSVSLALDNPDLLVVAVEPVPENAQLVRDNAALNGVQVQVLEAAIGAPDQKTAEVAYAYTGSENALHHAWVGNSTIVARQDCTVREVPAFSLGEIMKLLDETDPPSFVKIDTEGGEWAAFTDPAFRKVPLIRGELHPVNGHLPIDVEKLLGKSHAITYTGPASGPCGFSAVLR